MYWLLWGLLTAGTVYEIYFCYRSTVSGTLKTENKNYAEICFISLTVVMVLMAVLRYGQGTDYFGYKRIYEADSWSYHWLAAKEPLYRVLSYGMHKLNIPYEMFVAVISVFCMFCFWRFIHKYSPCETMSLLLMYPTLYLTYIFSAYRQAIAMSIFLGFLVPLIQERKWIRFIIGAIVAACFHKTAVMLLVLPVLLRIKYKYLCMLIAAAAIGGVLFCFIDISVPLEMMIQGSAAYYLDSWGSIDISIMGIAERTLMMGFVLWGSRKIMKEDNDTVEVLLCKIYVVGYMVSVFFVRYSMMSSRLGAFFKAVEIVLIPLLLARMEPKLRKIVAATFLLYVFIFMYKNLAMYIVQGGYLDVNVWNYPYISIFNRKRLNAYLIGSLP